ncbi:MAG TPA: ABC transporter ATP-binding protein [Coriobacteriia bacterium]|jgi:branched-chain amino acid transport system permease protein
MAKMEVATKVGATRITPARWALYATLTLAAVGLPIMFQALNNVFMVHIFGLMGIYVMLALGLNIVVGYAGLLDLGYIAFYAMGAYSGVILGSVGMQIAGKGFGPWAYWALLPVAAVVAAGTGIALGTPVLRLKGDYLAIVTLGFGEIVRIIATNWSQLTNGPAGLPRAAQFVPSPAGQQWASDHLSRGNFQFSADLWWYYVIGALCLVTVFFVRRLDNSRLGRAWVAMREDMVAAASVGINITTTKLWAFSLGALWGGIGGITYGYWVGFISPESFNFFESVLIVCMVVLGGMGSIPGAALGAVIIAGLPEIIRGLAQSRALSGVLTVDQAAAIGNYRYLIFGLLMVVMMAVRPQGILPSSRRARELHPEDEAILEEESAEITSASM